MEKRLFQILDEMNVLDGENNTALVQICGNQNVISVDKKGNHGEVKMGIPPVLAQRIALGEDLRMILCVIDGKKYDEQKSTPAVQDTGKWISAKEVEFAEWVGDRFDYAGKGNWDGDNDDTYNTAQLYQMFITQLNQ